MKPLVVISDFVQISKDTKKLIEECANLNVRLIKRLPFSLRFLVWSSPTAVRNPEISMVWQPVHNRRSIFSGLITYSFMLGSAFVHGLCKFFRYRGLHYFHIKNNSPVLLIIPSAITEQSDTFKTNYLIEAEKYPVDKLIFSNSKKTLKKGSRFSNLNYYTKTSIFFRLLSAIFFDFIRQLTCKKITWAYIDALVMFAHWILTQSWCFMLDFYYLVSRFADSNCYKSFLVLHEMHIYSRIVWQIAREKELLGITAQHALIVPEKLWYFPDISEIKANCPLPDVFFVYSEEIRELLSPVYPRTNFFICCSPRFRRWKSYSGISKSWAHHNNKQVILFANNAAILHDVVVLKALWKLIKQGLKDSFTLRLRLHPTERLNLKDQLQVWAVAASKKIEISSKSLQEDFEEVSLVIGANSTVVQEAFLMGVPIMEVFDRDFVVSSLLPTSFRCDITELNKRVLDIYMTKKPDKDLVEHYKANLGVFSPDLTTKLIYDFSNIAN